MDRKWSDRHILISWFSWKMTLSIWGDEICVYFNNQIFVPCSSYDISFFTWIVFYESDLLSIEIEFHLCFDDGARPSNEFNIIWFVIYLKDRHISIVNRRQFWKSRISWNLVSLRVFLNIDKQLIFLRSEMIRSYVTNHLLTSTLFRSFLFHRRWTCWLALHFLLSIINMYIYIYIYKSSSASS